MNLRLRYKRLPPNLACNNLLYTKRPTSEVVYMNLRQTETTYADKLLFSVGLKYDINAFSRKNEVENIDGTPRRLKVDIHPVGPPKTSMELLPPKRPTTSASSWAFQEMKAGPLARHSSTSSG